MINYMRNKFKPVKWEDLYLNQSLNEVDYFDLFFQPDCFCMRCNTLPEIARSVNLKGFFTLGDLARLCPARGISRLALSSAGFATSSTYTVVCLRSAHPNQPNFSIILQMT